MEKISGNIWLQISVKTIATLKEIIDCLYFSNFVETSSVNNPVNNTPKNKTAVMC
jgi:hypothetical protein